MLVWSCVIRKVCFRMKSLKLKNMIFIVWWSEVSVVDTDWSSVDNDLGMRDSKEQCSWLRPRVKQSGVRGPAPVLQLSSLWPGSRARARHHQRLDSSTRMRRRQPHPVAVGRTLKTNDSQPESIPAPNTQGWKNTFNWKTLKSSNFTFLNSPN